MSRILIVDDDPDICMLLSRFLTKKGYEAEAVYKGAEALEKITRGGFSLVLCDFKLPGEDGLELLKRIKKIDAAVAVIIVTGYSDIKIAVQSIKHGAFDYVTKPIHPEEILHTVQKALSVPRNDGEVAIKTLSKKSAKTIYIKGESPQARKVYQHIELVAPTDMSVVIQGETGIGKEHIANTIHHQSTRKNKPFIAIDCGALPRDIANSELFGHEQGAFTGAVKSKQGSFELADGGTLFLDEVANLTYDIQVKLLRVLQERKFTRVGGTRDIEIDIRILAASNEDLKIAVSEGRFREDLYHRLNEFTIHVPPLRERKGDILIFARHFLQLAAQELNKNVDELGEEVEQMLINYPWHGNLRELNNAVKRAVLLSTSEKLTPDCLPEEIAGHRVEVDGIGGFSGIKGTDLKAATEVAERQAIITALEQCNFNKSKAAKALNIDRKTLYNKLKSYNIEL